MFGGTVGIVTDSIYHLRRGEVYEINGKRILTISGATSTDKAHRKENIDWWPQETLAYHEQANALDNAVGHFDLVITHTAPSKIIDNFLVEVVGKHKVDLYNMRSSCQVSKFLQHLYDEGLSFDKWIFGHMHPDKIYVDPTDERFICLYNDVVEV